VSNRAGTLVSREQALTELSKRPSPRLAVVCLDSLNVFGDRPLTREHYFRIFDLFARYGVIGVMVVEENVVGSSDYATMLDDETIDYLSDTVISLTSEEDAGYHMRYLEVTKSRYQPQILGRHPVKTRPRSDKKTVPSPLGRRNGGIQVYPSLHSLMRASEQAGYSGAPALQDWSGLGHMIPANIAKPAVITIAGPLGTFKSTLAENFLVDGLMRKENCLLLRLHDRVADKFPGRLSEDLVLAASGHSWPRVRASDRESETISVPGHDVPGSDKVAERRWNPPGEAKLIELAFRSGNIAAEEFLDEVLTRLVEMKDAGRPIRRVVLDEVSLIGLSYPLLLSSHTGGQLFLPALVHMVRAFGAHMVMTGTRGDLADANACVDRACAISDAVLKSDFCDVFGEKHVTITGAGMTTGVGRVSEDARSSEYVPGVFRVADDSVALRPRPFRIDMEHLRGLVGFETNRIHRPGVSVHLFEQSGHIHRRYTGDLVKMLQFALASPPQKTGGSTAADVNVVAFNSRTATAMFDSLGVLNDAPIDRTVICTLDEFWQDDTIKHHHALAEFTLNDIRPPKDDIRQGDYVSMTTRTGCSGDDKPRTIAPYYRNVLLLAYRSDVLTEAEQGLLEDEHKSWSDVQWVADQVRRRQPFPHAFEYDLLATETRAAAMMDVILAKSPLARMKKLSLFAADESAERVLLDTDVDLIDNELKALVELLRMAPNRRVDSPAHLEDAEKLYELRRLSEHSAIYLCWYTHLRELVYRHDHLSSRMRFCALPSGGCTGDWFLGIARGSVSIGLGIDVLKILCSDTEEYKRFARGVGLPTVERFKKNGDAFPAWPGSQQMLGEVLGIHDRAWSRSDIANYKLFRRSLYTAFQEFAMSNDDRWQNVAERMFQQIKALQ